MSQLTHEARFTIALKASRHAVWTKLTSEIESWWPREYRAGPANARMTLEPVLGGQLKESDASGAGVLWYTVQALAPHESLTLAGFIAPPFGGPAVSLLRLTLHELSPQSTELEVHDTILGVADSATVHTGWQDIFGALASAFDHP